MLASAGTASAPAEAICPSAEARGPGEGRNRAAGRPAIGQPLQRFGSSGAIMKLVPLGDKIIVKRLEAEQQTAGGIVLPDSAREKPRQGRVLSVGDGVLLSNGVRAASQVSEGDRVLFGSYAGSEVEINGEDLLILREDEILARVE
jgi:chaperonin GroES